MHLKTFKIRLLLERIIKYNLFILSLGRAGHISRMPLGACNEWYPPHPTPPPPPFIYELCKLQELLCSLKGPWVHELCAFAKIASLPNP